MVDLDLVYMERDAAALRAENAALVRDKAQLLRFAGLALQTHHEGGEWDGFDLQSNLEQCGLLEQEIMEGPCHPERCVCAEVADFPMVCYRPTDLGAAALEANAT